MNLEFKIIRLFISKIYSIYHNHRLDKELIHISFIDAYMKKSPSLE